MYVKVNKGLSLEVWSQMTGFNRIECFISAAKILFISSTHGQPPPKGNWTLDTDTFYLKAENSNKLI